MIIKGNQYLPNGFGKSASTYWYIQRNNNGKVEYYHHDGKWRKKTLIEMKKYAFYNLQDAEDRLIYLNGVINGSKEPDGWEITQIYQSAYNNGNHDYSVRHNIHLPKGKCYMNTTKSNILEEIKKVTQNQSL